jgi:ABC-type microcin C transport system duplicated ATPase subunit YejF
VQKEIVDLLRQFQEAHSLSYLFISHDLAVVRAMADEVIVMKNGRVVERGTTEEIFADPKDPYTRALMAAAFQPIAPREGVASGASPRTEPQMISSA